MTHLAEGQLRAHLDGELDPDEARHLDVCPECQARLATLAAQHARVAEKLGALSPHAPARPSHAAWLTFQAQYSPEINKEKTIMSQKHWARLRPVLTGLVALLVVLALFTLAPVQNAFSAFLGLFRVQQVTVLPVDIDNLSSLNNNQALAQQMSQLFSSSVNVIKEPGESRDAASAEEASQLAGFEVRTLNTDLAGPTLMVSDSSAFEFTVNRAEAQAIIDDLGRSDLQLPAALDGVTIHVEIPAGVMSLYGDCTPPTEAEREIGQREWNPRGCVEFVQMPSPTVNTSSNVEVAALAEIGLQLTGMSADEARAFSQSVDWASTLVIPVPRNATTYKDVTVDGVTGQFISYAESANVPTRYAVIWVKNGIVYGLIGFGSESEGLALANSLK